MKINLNVYFHKPFEAPQRSVKINILIFTLRLGSGQERLNCTPKTAFLLFLAELTFTAFSCELF